MAENFEAKIYRVENLCFPIVKAAFEGANGNIYMGIMLVDSGSVDCILNKTVLEVIDKASVNEDTKKQICTVKGEGETCPSVNLHFKIGNGIFENIFYVNSSMEFGSMFGNNFIGIIGQEFMRKNNMVLDYYEQKLRTSTGKLDKAPEEYSFYFPMEYGLKLYDIPVVGFVQGDKEFIMVADSGANTTVMTKHVIEEGNFVCGEQSCAGSVTCITNKEMESYISNVSFSLISIGGTEKDPKLVNATDTVQIIDYCDYVLDDLKDKEGNEILPISGLLSSEFMLAHKWVLDFGIGAIYSME